MKNKVKKFSTIALLTIALPFALCSSAFAGEKNDAFATQCAFRTDAPDQHVVVRGDTLWGISLKFLEHAWCWPNVWGMNREQIKNPHWIYPGQVVYLDREAGRLRLGKALGNGSLPEVRLSPRIRHEGTGAISTISASVLEPFLYQPIVLETDELAHAPHVVSATRSHLLGANSEKAYVRGDLQDQTHFHLYRPSVRVIDPETKKLLGYEYAYVGSAELTKLAEKPDEAHTFLITQAKEEITDGDRLMPTPAKEVTNYVPHPPSEPVTGRIISVYDGVALAGHNQTVLINLGENEGMDVGTVLTLYRNGKAVVDKVDNNKVVILPDEEYGTLLVYRVFKNVSYGIIMAVNETTRIGDTVKSPEGS